MFFHINCGRFQRRFLTIFALIINVFIHFTVFSANANFNHIDVRHGLAYNSVRDIAQDQFGYMWFGTELGLSRYDGTVIKNYFADKKKTNTIADSYVRAVEVDHNNVLWVSSSQSGLSRYNRATDDFTVFTHSEKNSNSLSSNSITAIQRASNNTLWIATSKGIDKFNTQSNNFEHFFYFTTPLNQTISASNADIRDISLSRDGIPWLGSNKGLSYLNPSENEFTLINLKEGKQPTVLSIAHTDSGIVWVGTREGLFLYDPSTNKSKHFDLGEDVKRVHSLMVDSEKNLWVGTSKFGIFRVDPYMNIINMKPDKTNKNAISGKTIFDLFIDHSGLLWIASYNSGLSTLNPHSIYFGSFNNSQSSLNCLDSVDIRSALALDNNTILLGTISGLTEVDLLKKQCIKYEHKVDDVTTLSNNEVYAIHKTAQGSIWIGTSNGINKFDRIKGKFERYLTKSSNNKHVDVYKILEHEKGLLLATGRGLFVFSTDTLELIKLMSDMKEFNDSQVYSMVKGIDGTIWIGSLSGLFFVDESLSPVSPVITKGKSLIKGDVRGVTVDFENNIWFTIDESGLFRYSPKLKQLESFENTLGMGIRNGFSGLYSYSDKKSIWLTTYNRGLFNIDLETVKVKNYRTTDGLHSELFNHNSSTTFPDGRLLFGGKTGFNIFHPNNIIEHNFEPIVSISNFKRFGETVIPCVDYDGLLIEEHISNVNTLALGHKDTVFGFEFIALDYLNSDSMSYLYKLDGFDKDWTETSAQNRGVTYNNVSPGDYIFRVKAKNSRGTWSKNNVTLKITINPAPWLTWWAYTTYAVTLILLTWFTVNKRTQWLKKKALELENTVNVRTKELATEKEKVEQLLSRKNEEFANVSHEFRTPLTLVLGPISLLLDKTKNEQSIKQLNVIQRNAYRLLRMVDQLLNLETFRIKSITQKSPQAIAKIITLMAEAFKPIADEKNISLNISNIEDINFEFTPDALEKIILNLLSNAIKYSKSGDDIYVTAKRDANDYVIEIKDSGIGIPANRLNSIFERYIRVLDKNSEQVTGAGIGLSLVKSLVEAHEGCVQIESQLGVGTNIEITLPIINQVNSIDISNAGDNELVAMELMGISNNSVADSDKTNELKSEHQISRSDIKKLTLLVIEDNQDMRSFIVENLTQTYHILTAKNGAEGVARAIEHVPDVIISDVMMPYIDGYQTTKLLRENDITSHIPIILLTARGDRVSRLKGWKEKADEYLTKPFDVEELKIRLSNLLEIRQILKRRFSEFIFDNSNSNKSKFKTNGDNDLEQSQLKFIDLLNNKLNSLYQTQSLSVSDIAKQVAMSERQFFRKLRSILDMTPSDYLRRFRLEKSKILLREGKSANFTAIDVGFSSQAYFSTCFKAQYGTTPSQYRMNQKQ